MKNYDDWPCHKEDGEQRMGHKLEPTGVSSPSLLLREGDFVGGRSRIIDKQAEEKGSWMKWPHWGAGNMSPGDVSNDYGNVKDR